MKSSIGVIELNWNGEMNAEKYVGLVADWFGYSQRMANNWTLQFNGFIDGYFPGAIYLCN